MAENRPLTESAELSARHGVSLTAAHRTKLQKLGLIATTTKPFAHELTSKGWDWVKAQAGSQRPVGQMNLGPLYAVVGALSELAARNGLALQDLLDPKLRVGAAAAPAQGAISQAAWSEADQSLAFALQDLPKLERAFERLRSDVGGAHLESVRRAEASATLVLQWVRQAARKRLVSATATSGQEVDFDPVHYDVDDEVAAGARVRVRKPSVVRGSGPAQVVVARGEADVLT